MTTYLERLKARSREKHLGEQPSKPSKAPYEGFEGDRGRLVSENIGPSTPIAVVPARSDKRFPNVNLAARQHLNGGEHRRDGDAEVQQFAFDERAAICEFDGGLPRSHAELVALACTVPLAAHETLESRDATIIHFADHLDRLRKQRKFSATRTLGGRP